MQELATKEKTVEYWAIEVDGVKSTLEIINGNPKEVHYNESNEKDLHRGVVRLSQNFIDTIIKIDKLLKSGQICK